jgi:hypothetical protein
VNKLNLTKIKKCDQVWEDMTPNERGRICSKCQNTIIDFRPLDDKEVAEIHLFSEGRVCGIYRKDQIELNTKEKRSSKWRSGILAVLGMFTSINLVGQENADSLKIEILEPEYQSKRQLEQDLSRRKKEVKNDSLLVYGKIHNENGEPLIGVSVLMRGKPFGTVSDAHGFYMIDIKKAIVDTSEIVFVYSYIGVTTKEVVLDKNSLMGRGELEVNPILEEDYSIEMDFAVTYKKDRFHHRVWRRIKGVFRKKR